MKPELSGAEIYDLLEKLGWMGWGKASKFRRNTMLSELGVDIKEDELNHCMSILAWGLADKKDLIPNGIAAVRQLSALGKEMVLSGMANGSITSKTTRKELDNMRSGQRSDPLKPRHRPRK